MFTHTRIGLLGKDAEIECATGRVAAPFERAEQQVQSSELDRVYKEHFAFVWRSLRRLGVPPFALDDAAQDVFIVALRRSSEFRQHSSYRTWLFGIASNVAREQQRTVHRAAAHEPVDESLPTDQRSPLEQATSSQELRFVEAFLATLDPAKREVFILAELEQMAAPEIADALGVKLNTIYSRLRAARGAFVAMVERWEGKP